MSTQPESAAVAVLALAQRGRFEAIRDRFAARIRPLVGAEALRTAWDSAIGQLGPVTAAGTPSRGPVTAGPVLVSIPLTFERGTLNLVVSVGDDGSLLGIQLTPAQAADTAAPWEPSSYVDSSAFTEQDVTVGTGPLAVPGTLTRPVQPGPWSAVVHLPGSGPSDRDGTIGVNKPLKDLAWGLASRGIAVLRFDKVTLAHRAEVAHRTDFTLTDEYVPAAAAAIDVLRREPSVDRIFVVGHSLGGTVAPRVTSVNASVAGLVILAGGAQPLHWAIVRQLRYLTALNPSPAGIADPVVEAATRQATLVDSPELGPSTPSSDLPFGVPAAYWLDLRRYDPVATAAKLTQPILILQGGRDYQATEADDLARWRTGLADRANVTIRVYPADNHAFFPGEDPSTPSEYALTNHMDPAVVADISSWVSRGGR